MFGRDEPARARRVLGRVRQCDDAAVRVSEEVELLLAEVRAQLLDVGDVVGGRVRAGVVRRVGAGGSARVEQDERERVAEPGEVREVAATRSRGRPGWQTSSGPDPSRR